MAKELKRRIVAEFSAKNKAKGEMASFRRGLDSTGKAMKRMAKVGAVMTIAAAAGLAYMVKRQMEAIDVIAKLSDRLGITTEDLVGLQHAASISGVSTESLNKSLDMFVRRLGEMTMGSGEAKRGLEMLGLTMAELIRLSPAEAMGIAADKINRLETQAEKAAAAYFLFGRAGAQLVTMFAVGSEGLREFQREAEKLGLTFSRIDAAQIEAANDALTRARAVMTGLFRQVTIELAPYIEAAATAFVDFATAGEGVGVKVVNAFEAISLSIVSTAEEVERLIKKLSALASPVDYMKKMTKATEAAWKRYRQETGETMAGKYTLGPLYAPVQPKKRELFARILAEERAGVGVEVLSQESRVRAAFENIRKKAAGETTKSIKEQYADVLRAKIDMIDKEIAENERKIAEAKKAAEDEKNIIIKAAQEQVKFVREQDYMTRQQRIDNLNAYVEANETALNLVLEANKIVADELGKLERGKFEDTKRWLTEASDLWTQFDKIVVKALDGMADALTDLCLTGKADFKALAQSVITDITRMMIKMQMAEALGIGGAGGGGGIGSYFMAGVSALFGGPAAGAAGGPPTTAGVQSYALGGYGGGLQHGGTVIKTGWAEVHRGETFSGIDGGKGNLDVHIHNEGQEKLEISEVEEYTFSDQRIIDVTITAAGSHGPYRRSIKQIR